MADAAFTILFWAGFVGVCVFLAVAHNRPFRRPLLLDPEKELFFQQGLWPFFLRRTIGGLAFIFLMFLNHYVEGRPLSWWHVALLFLLGCVLGSVWETARHARSFLKMGKSGLEISGKRPGSSTVLAWPEIEEITTVRRAFTDLQKVMLVLVDKTKNPIRLQPSDYGCPPAFLFAALKAYHAAAPFVETELLVREEEERQYIC